MNDDLTPADWDLIGRALTRYGLDLADREERERVEELTLAAFMRAAEVAA